MNIFLEEMSKEFAGDKIILVMDGAGWHKAKNLQVPDNVEIILLPPYSPERWSSGKILAAHQAKYYQKSNLQNLKRTKRCSRKIFEFHEFGGN